MPNQLTVTLVNGVPTAPSGTVSTLDNVIATGLAPYGLSAVTGSQFGLAITTNTTLTVPVGSRMAQISVETANVRWTDDGTSATASVGHPVTAGSSFQYAGPLAALKFTAVSGSPTINVSYYK